MLLVHHARAGLVALLASVAVLLPTPGWAADDLPRGDFSATYTGTLVSREGASARRSARATVTVVCRGDTCTVTIPKFYQPPHATVTVPRASVLTYSRTERPRNESCPNMRIVTRESMRVDGAGASYTFDQPKVVQEKCVGGRALSAVAYGRTHEFAGTLSALEQAEDDTAGSSSAGAADAAGRDGRTLTSGTSHLADGDPGAPSVLSAAPTLASATVGGGNGLVLLVVVVVLVLLIAFPTHLLNSAVESWHERWHAWRRRGRAVIQEQAPGPSLRGWAAAAAVVLAASVIGAFVDPEFGLNTGSLRVLLSLALALGVESILVWSLVIWGSRRASPSTVAGFQAAPGTLVVVVAAVLLTRLTGFEPGIIFGAVAGVTFSVAATRAAQGRVALAGAGLAFVLALLGWVGYSLLGPAEPGDGFVRTFTTETLSGLAVAGIASLPLALVPLRGLAGHALWSWSRRVWAGAYAAGLVGFFLVLMPMPFSWDEVGLPLRTWVLLYLAYAGVAVVAWLVSTKPWHQEDATAA